MGEAAAEAVAFKKNFDVLHALIYFAPEAQERLSAVGLEGGSMAYFASRSAAMGPVGPAVVTATFHNFNPETVARSVPRAWELATPEAILAARFAAVDDAYRRLLGEETLASAAVAEAAELAREATEGATPEGRPLYAGHAHLAWPEQPHLVLWHALTLLREYRGDAHVAALTVHGLSGLAALVTHTATGDGTAAAAVRRTRGWSDEQWDAEVAALTDDGILAADGTLTERGQDLRERVEAATNAASRGPWQHLGAEKTARLAELCRPLGRTAIKAGAIPSLKPRG
ncbi:SCO6745 family protein [Amycolatopsis benzoatilytica]|uniref:SCO6745 family protein n=1 Tax=Amycolatopsis benzoatilytica TaxID=346045 RepID=UPI00037689B9|nr:hypothetical protein [Amycolatopsis benzoatilytica]